jgi:hypothetical protein
MTGPEMPNHSSRPEPVPVLQLPIIGNVGITTPGTARHSQSSCVDPCTERTPVATAQKGGSDDERQERDEDDNLAPIGGLSTASGHKRNDHPPNGTDLPNPPDDPLRVGGPRLVVWERLRIARRVRLSSTLVILARNSARR